MIDNIRVAALQTKVLPTKEENLLQLEAWMEKTEIQAVDLVTVGEMFACPYDTKNFSLFAEDEGGPCWHFLSRLAAKHSVYLSAGSLPEISKDGKIYNTAYVFDRTGKQIAKHRKMHLFDINVHSGQSFRESDVLSPGNSVTVFDTEFGKIGICICFDFRFPELARLLALQGVRLILVPAAFNCTTGPDHWELMFRSRAVDNQLFVLATSPARDLDASYIAWGHSLAVDPWGMILSQLDEKEGILLETLPLARTDSIRAQLPLLSARRTDIYDLRILKTDLMR